MTTERAFGRCRVVIADTTDAMARAAAADAAGVLRDAITARGEANVMLATGQSQVAFLAHLVEEPHLDWAKVRGFHMDEYVALPERYAGAGFAHYMRERVAAKVRLREFNYLRMTPGPAAAAAEAQRYAGLLAAHPLDLVVLGIGENGHLAFNDPPVADFDDPQVMKVVTLDDACRAQQVGEGWFPTVAEVPTHAITATIPTLLAARRVIAVVPEARKRGPVRRALIGPVTTDCPASVLQRGANARVYLDADAAAGLDQS